MPQNENQLYDLLNMDSGINNGFFVRDTRKEDIPGILAAQEAVLRAADYDPQWLYPFCKEELEELMEEGAVSIGAYAEGSLIAFRAACFSGHEYEEITRALGSPFTDIPCLLLYGMFVVPAWRGRHLQQKLTELCIDRCKERGIGTFLATVHPGNDPSLKSLKNLGFQVRAKKMLYGKEYERLILVKEMR
jgi:GNAT superfamily N-acetyltransferase